MKKNKSNNILTFIMNLTENLTKKIRLFPIYSINLANLTITQIKK